RAWESIRPEGSGHPTVVGGAWWSIARLVLAVIVLSSIGFALLGYATLASHIHAAVASTCLLVTIALLVHRLAASLLEAMAAANTPTGRWARHRLGLPADAVLRGQYLV